MVIKPNARNTAVEVLPDGSCRVSVREPPVSGKANAALIRALAGHFSRPKSAIRILHGLKGKKKIVEID